MIWVVLILLWIDYIKPSKGTPAQNLSNLHTSVIKLIYYSGLANLSYKRLS